MRNNRLTNLKCSLKSVKKPKKRTFCTAEDKWGWRAASRVGTGPTSERFHFDIGVNTSARDSPCSLSSFEPTRESERGNRVPNWPRVVDAIKRERERERQTCRFVSSEYETLSGTFAQNCTVYFIWSGIVLVYQPWPRAYAGRFISNSQEASGIVPTLLVTQELDELYFNSLTVRVTLL